MKLSDHKALVFDVYGTLVDWESGLYTALQPILPPGWSRKDALLAFDSVEADLRAQHPTMLYSDMLAAAHQQLAARLAGDSAPPPAPAPAEPSSSAAPPAGPDPHRAFAASIAAWPVFPDTVAALHALSKHFRLCVLSNVDRASFAHTRAALRAPFSLVLTAQDTGAYKPLLAGFEQSIARITQGEWDSADGGGPVFREEILVVAQGLPSDHVPARALGLHSVHIARAGAYTGVNGAGTQPSWTFSTLGEMAATVEKELAEGN